MRIGVPKEIKAQEGRVGLTVAGGRVVHAVVAAELEAAGAAPARVAVAAAV
jgi:alanine dehydrogenase